MHSAREDSADIEVVVRKGFKVYCWPNHAAIHTEQHTNESLHPHLVSGLHRLNGLHHHLAEKVSFCAHKLTLLDNTMAKSLL
jgi:hypothetical protein